MLIGQTITVIGGGIGGWRRRWPRRGRARRSRCSNRPPRSPRSAPASRSAPMAGLSSRRSASTRPWPPTPPASPPCGCAISGAGRGLHDAAHPRRPPVARRPPGRPRRHPRPRLPRGRRRHPPRTRGSRLCGGGRPRRSSPSPRPRPNATASPSPPTASTRPRAPRSTPGPAPSSPARSPGAPRSPMTAPCRRRRMSSWAPAATWCATRSGGAGSSTSWRWRNATPGPPRAGTTPTTRRTCAAPSRISAPRSGPSSTGSRRCISGASSATPSRRSGPMASLRFSATRRIPTLPFLAQGANMALEDAWSLVAALAADPDSADALRTYAELRRPRTARIVQAAEDNATNYHLRPGPWRFAAHGALRLAGRFAPHAVTGPLRMAPRPRRHARRLTHRLGSPSSFRKYRSGEREGAKRPSPGSAPKATIRNDKVAKLIGAGGDDPEENRRARSGEIPQPIV
jgi:hypothetical protein